MKTIDLAYYITNHFENITHLKLQKLLYYLKVWGIVSGEELVEGDFVKWQYGPVNKEVYDAFKNYGNTVIPKNLGSDPAFTTNQKKFTDFVLECYTPFGALTLSSMSHAETPWSITKPQNVISEQSMKKYYSELLFAKNFPLGSSKPFYPVQTNMYHSYVLDMSEEEAKKYTVYPSFEIYKQQVAEAQQQSAKILSKLVQQ